METDLACYAKSSLVANLQDGTKEPKNQTIIEQELSHKLDQIDENSPVECKIQ